MVSSFKLRDSYKEVSAEGFVNHLKELGLPEAKMLGENRIQLFAPNGKTPGLELGGQEPKFYINESGAKVVWANERKYQDAFGNEKTTDNADVIERIGPKGMLPGDKFRFESQIVDDEHYLTDGKRRVDQPENSRYCSTFYIGAENDPIKNNRGKCIMRAESFGPEDKSDFNLR